jgi:type I restriction-modification system DNA methylase subunit
VARVNRLLHGVEDFQIERGNTLRNPVFTDPATDGTAVVLPKGALFRGGIEGKIRRHL